MPRSDLPPSSFMYEDDLEQITFSASDLAFELGVTSAILRSLDVDQILYVVLSGVTSGEGLGFNRAVCLLVDRGSRALRTSMAVGPIDKADAHRIWEEMRERELTLGALLQFYESVKDDPQRHRLTRQLSGLTIPLDLLDQYSAQAANPSVDGTAAVEPMIAKCLLARRPVSSRTLQLSYHPPGSLEPFCFRNWWMVPLVTPEHLIGLLLVDDAFSDRTVSARQKHLLYALANLATIAVEKGRMFDELRSLAEVDGLTGLANRRTYDAHVTRLVRQARQTGRPLSLVLLDIDYFKRYNDMHGHLAGDDALRLVARVLHSHTRAADTVARYGGEEFALLLADTSLEQASQVAHKLLFQVREQSRGFAYGPVTVSAGVACSVAGTRDETALFAAADRALYQAKRNGRDQVCCEPD